MGTSSFSSSSSSSATDFHLSATQSALAETLLQDASVDKAIKVYATEMANKLHYNTPGFAKGDSNLDDLIIAGQCGVCKAAETYNPNHVGANGKTANPVTHAINMARYAIYEEFNRIQGLTVAEGRTRANIFDVVDQIADELGIPTSEVTDEMISQTTGMKVDTVRKYRQQVITAPLSNDDFDDEDSCNEYGQPVVRVYYNNTIAGRNRELANFATKDVPFIQCSLNDSLVTAFEILNKRETRAVVYSHGLFGKPKMSNKDIARMLKLSASAVSMMISTALDKMLFNLTKHASIKNMSSPRFAKYHKNWRHGIPNKEILEQEDVITMLFA